VPDDLPATAGSGREAALAAPGREPALEPAGPPAGRSAIESAMQAGRGAPAPMALGDEPAPAPRPRLGRRLLGVALLCATLGFGSCHALLSATFA
jgi:hypothetical protein